MSKKTVVITGSPRKIGNRFAMTEAFIKAADITSPVPLSLIRTQKPDGSTNLATVSLWTSSGQTINPDRTKADKRLAKPFVGNRIVVTSLPKRFSALTKGTFHACQDRK